MPWLRQQGEHRSLRRGHARGDRPRARLRLAGLGAGEGVMTATPICISYVFPDHLTGLPRLFRVCKTCWVIGCVCETCEWCGSSYNPWLRDDLEHGCQMEMWWPHLDRIAEHGYGLAPDMVAG